MLRIQAVAGALVSLFFAFGVGCSTSDYKMVEVQKDQQFFSQFQNTSQEMSVAAQNIEKIKILQTNDDYPIRLAIFDNGQFYYQVDELGTGYGEWVYHEGGLRLTAKRKIFDMNFFLSAANEQGDAVVVKFFDRYGMNSYNLDFRNPKKMEEEGVRPEKLREFKSSIKDI